MVTSHAEYGPIRTLILKRPEAAFVSTSVLAGQWKALNFAAEPDLERARREYADFEKMVLGAMPPHVVYLPVEPEVTIDSIYCRDAVLATDFGLIVLNMGKPARAGEPLAIRKAAEAAGFPILGEIRAPGTVEGGDCCWLDPKTLAVGHSYRTNESGIIQLRQLLDPIGLSVAVVPLPHYRGTGDVFHLMSIISPVDRDVAVVYSSLMPIMFRNVLLAMGYQLVEVPAEEFDTMGCNVLSIGARKCLMIKGNPITKERLQKAGCEVVAYDGNEISLKGGGGPTCLTRPIQRLID